MTQQNYRPNVHYAPALSMTASMRKSHRLSGDAIRGILIGVAMAVLMWMPIVWGVTRLI